MPTDAVRSLRGTKRACRSCEVRFYDLGRDPTVCPSCGASLPMSDFEPVRQQAVGYQPYLRAAKPKFAIVQGEDQASARSGEDDTAEANEDESSSSSDTDGDVLLEEESDDDVTDLLTPDESDTGS
jgi:uncharacterized protein (TIGR02300 family)